ncbi:MAG: hypothetical protein JO306_09590, partial [Gemmatimonadetes bacterium]|nr:hypothetical protein [Gemmatimonadota bacterium]
MALGGTLAFLAIAGWVINWFEDAVRLPMLIVVALVALLAAIAFVVIAFGVFRLVNGTQALGLPAGSVQAIIALSLILLFATMTVFLVVVINKNNTSTAAVDITKQVLTILGTLVTAVSSFYFGSRSTTDAVRGTQIPRDPDDGHGSSGSAALPATPVPSPAPSGQQQTAAAQAAQQPDVAASPAGAGQGVAASAGQQQTAAPPAA